MNAQKEYTYCETIKAMNNGRSIIDFDIFVEGIGWITYEKFLDNVQHNSDDVCDGKYRLRNETN